MPRGRFLISATGVGLAAVFGWATPAAAQVKAVKCRDCHPDIYAEWKDSQHANAWSDPRFQAALKTAEQPERCTPCHAPEPIFEAGVGAPPVLRRRYKSEGVTCVTCHAKGDGYVGPYPGADMDDTGHYSSQSPAFTDTALCATCHGQPKEAVHNQLRDFLQSPQAKKGKHCQDCHMPRVLRAPAVDALGKVTYRKRPGRQHLFSGSHDAGMLAKAATMEIVVAEGQATVRVTNAEAAHGIPAAADRVLRVEITVQPANGAAATTIEVWGWDERLQAGTTRTATVPLPAGGGIVKAALWHCFAREDPRADWAAMTAAEVRYK